MVDFILPYLEYWRTMLHFMSRATKKKERKKKRDGEYENKGRDVGERR